MERRKRSRYRYGPHKQTAIDAASVVAADDDERLGVGAELAELWRMRTDF